jgi:tRNA threonylcarbamoyladenosine biosynthesis protein TsaB
MTGEISIAIESSCRSGGIALGVGDTLVESLAFDASARQAAQLLSYVQVLLENHHYQPKEVRQVYVSAGPGSFTGLRLGITVARTMAQALGVQCVSVPTLSVVAENAQEADWSSLAVVLDAKEGWVYTELFERKEGRISEVGGPTVKPAAQFLAETPRPLLLIGEGLGYHELGGPEITIGEKSLWFPTVEKVWHVGRKMAKVGEFTDYRQILPIYTRKPEATRLWEKRHGSS